MKTILNLTPVQQKAADGLSEGIRAGGVLVLQGGPGSGKTTVLQQLHSTHGGALLGARHFMETLSARGPDVIEEAFLSMVEEALAGHDLVFVDDLHLITRIVGGSCYSREYLLDAALTAILADIIVHRKTVVFALEGEAPWPIERRAYAWEIGAFGSEDYACVCGAADAEWQLDYSKIHQFCPALNAHQLRNASMWLAQCEGVDTAAFIEYLREHHMKSNVQLEEVQPVDWKDLKGVDDVIRALEAKIALPFENDELTARLGLKPKRGVLLAGPPGTGKTTIGRALAHRLKSKFFLIDGTLVAGSRNFYGEVKEVFDEARRNAPSVIFIDDSDVIFENQGERGLYRYLLTMMDGLESASAGRVCVMMTAMNVNSLPAAMVRSGRVELWLETRPPDLAAREEILRSRLAGLPGEISATDVARIAAASNGMTGADLKAVVEDGKLLFAHDLATGTPLRLAEEYFLEAIEEVRANRRNYARSRPADLPGAPTMGFIGE